MSRYVFPALFLGALFLVGRFQRDVTVHAAGSGGAFGGNGDVTGDGKRDLSDAIYLLTWLFQGGPPPVAIADSQELLDRVASLESGLQGEIGNRIGADAALGGRIDGIGSGTGLTLEQKEILSHASIVSLDDGKGGQLKTIRWSEVNLQIVNGLGATNGFSGNPSSTDPAFTSTNGLGNLIVGYGEPGSGSSDRTGSHNLVLGQEQDYSSFGGLVAGRHNAATGPYASVSGGSGNTASGVGSSVCGGVANTASGNGSAVNGGIGNSAEGNYSSIGGGQSSTASGRYASVGGGLGNTASGDGSAVGGGTGNTASGVGSTVGGGTGSTAGRDGEVLGDSFSKPRFVDNGDGTVTDKRTGLLWQKDTDPTVRTWSAAWAYCYNLQLAGHQDWRMPNLEELLSILDETRQDPAADPVFGTVSAFYWSSSTFLGSPDVAWIVDFGFSQVQGIDSSNFLFVRAVRNGS